MKTFLLIDSSDIDKFVNEKVLRYNGVDKIKSFETIQDGLDFLKESDSPKATMLLDLQTLIRSYGDFKEKIKTLTDYKGEFELYILSLADIYPSDKKILTDNNFFDIKGFKGFIEKPLTVEKIKEILSDN